MILSCNNTGKKKSFTHLGAQQLQINNSNVKGQMVLPVHITASYTLFNMHSQKDGMNDVSLTYNISFWFHLRQGI